MEPVLLQRYLVLFLAYGAGERGDLVFIKGELLSRLQKFLRPDAALLLLSLYDQMILRPYAGSIQVQTPSGSQQLPLPGIAQNESAFSERVRRSLDAILGALENVHERPISSHQVLMAILGVWPTISELYGWA
jgi:hypothetical protein